MSTYAVGDIQGCYKELLALEHALNFTPQQDRLIFVGDLVNRGPDSLQVLRHVRDLGSSATVVLGNHDLHLLAVARGARKGRRDTLDAILAAPDCAELLAWLAQCPLAWQDPASGSLLIHAGLPPQWSVEQSLRLADEAHQWISGPRQVEFLADMYGDQPDIWSEGLTGTSRIRFIVNCLTRWRYCDAVGRALLSFKGRPDTAGDDQAMPWFQAPGRRSSDTAIVFGHWSTLGHIHWPEHNIFCLDTGCIWGGRLSAMDLETREIFQVASQQAIDPAG